MSNSDTVRNDNDSKKIFTMIVLVLTLMICTTSATYAYFAFEAVATNNITGTAATASLTFEQVPTLISPSSTTYSSKPLVPQYSLVGATNVLQKAVTGVDPEGGSTPIPCVDANGNAVCRVYSFTVKNSSTANAVIKGQIKFTYPAGTTFTNLKWKLMDSATAVTVASDNTGTVATTDFVNFDTGVSLAVNATKQYWVVLWIEETGGNQNTTDAGTFYATIQFVNNIDGTGITSTITS